MTWTLWILGCRLVLPFYRKIYLIYFICFMSGPRYGSIGSLLSQAPYGASCALVPGTFVRRKRWIVLRVKKKNRQIAQSAAVTAVSTAATSANIEATDGSLGVDEQTTMTIARNHPPSKARYIVVAAGIWSNSVEAESLVKMGIRLASALPSVWFFDERKSERFLAETLFLSENAPGANTILLLCLAGPGWIDASAFIPETVASAGA